MIDVDFSIDEDSWRREWRELDMDVGEKVERLFHVTGAEAVAFLRSLTSKLQPPVGAGEAWRRAHPGGWADVTGALALAYGYEVIVYGSPSAPTAWGLLMTNTMEYAVYLEDRNGYWVLSGITDPGAPLDRALRSAAEALGFKVA
jgi:hypothetical protein